MNINLSGITGIVAGFIKSSFAALPVGAKTETQPVATADSRAIEHMLAAINVGNVNGVVWGTDTHTAILNQPLPSVPTSYELNNSSARTGEVNYHAAMLRHKVHAMPIAGVASIQNDQRAPLKEGELEVIIRTFIPDDYLLAPIPSKGDSREVGEKVFDRDAYRTEQRIRVQLDERKSEGKPFVGYDKDTGYSVGMTMSTGLPIGGPTIFHPARAKAKGETLKLSEASRQNNVIKFTVSGDERYPLATSPGITYNFKVQIREERGFHFVKVESEHDGFPAYEVLALRKGWDKPQVIYKHDYRETGDTIGSLFPPIEYSSSKEVLLDKEK